MTRADRAASSIALLAAACAAAAFPGRMAAAAEAAPISLRSLLEEMTDPDRLARWPEPAYRCLQSSSHDRRSRTRSDPGGWFANTDNMDGLGADLRWESHGGRREAVLLDVEGPGCIVRFWTGGNPPKGKVRFYLDGAEEPAIEEPLGDLLGGRSFVPRPLGIENSGAADNLYLPIPYAKSAKITYDEAVPVFGGPQVRVTLDPDEEAVTLVGALTVFTIDWRKFANVDRVFMIGRWLS